MRNFKFEVTKKETYNSSLSRLKGVSIAIFKETLVFMSALVISFVSLTPPLLANPQGGSVAAGGAAISTNGGTVFIDQTTGKAIINWETFNIGPNETTQFRQPSSSSITLNRINGANGASSIFGRLTANGQVWLLNPAGILFGAGSQINVAGLLATTANISNEDFMSGNYKFTQSQNATGAIVNEGTIIAQNGGYVVLVGTGVANSGTITANLGKVALAAGNVYTVDFYGDNMLSFGAGPEAAVTQKAVNARGEVMNDAVSNSGKIIANGGRVVMSARTAENIVSNVINMSGTIEARSATQHGGEIILSGGDTGTVHISGKMHASAAKGSGLKGGKVHITGAKVALVDKALIDVSGDTGGGEVLIGGDAHGANPAIKNAQRTFVGGDVKINADALTAGDGGKVVVWADGDTRFYGSISARGGELSGNGGWIETSGKENLQAYGFVDASAPNGIMGTWLLDPKNIIVATGGGATLAQTTTFASDAALTDTIDPATINVAAANVVLQANNDITFNNAVSIASGGKTLTVQAGRSILINANVATNNATITMTANDSAAQAANRDAGAGNITMAAGTSISVGTKAVNLTISPLSGSFTPGNMMLYGITAGINSTFTSPGAVTLNGAVNTGAGTLAINANTSGGATPGNIDFTFGSGGSITTANKAVTVTINSNGGTGGIFLNNAAGTNITTGGAAVILDTTGGGTSTTGGSITQSGANNTIDTGGGNITLQTPTVGSSSVGTSGQNIITTAAAPILTLSAGAGGAFVSNTGNLTLAAPTLNANSPLSVISSGVLLLPNVAISTGTGDLTLKK